MQVSSNMNAMIASAGLQKANLDAQRSIQKLSSGSKVNYAADDPSVIGPASKLKAQIVSRVAVATNINAAIGAGQVLENGLAQINDLLMSAREAAITSSGSLASSATAQLTTYQTAITDIKAGMKFNGVDTTGAITVVVDPAGGTFAMAAKTGIPTTLTASSTLSEIDTMIDNVASDRATAGAELNSLYSLASANSSINGSQSAAYGSMTSVDYGAEVANLASAQIRQNTSAAMMGQAHSMSRELVSYLLKGI
jgi:flagellin